MEKFIERRDSERLNCQKHILHSTNPPDFYYRGRVCNYSKTGLYFESNVDLLPDDEIHILVKKNFHSEDEPHHALNVKIVWCKQLQGASFDLGYGATLKQRDWMDN
jgi:hypothetical protein